METEVEWFFCDHDAKVYPGHTRFGSGVWASERYDWPGTGEVLGAANKFKKGKRPVLNGRGLGFCGPKDAIEFGYDPAKHHPLNHFADGSLKCCPSLRIPLVLTINPGTVDSQIFGGPCGACPRMGAWRLVADGSGFWGVPAGTEVCVLFPNSGGGCNWVGSATGPGPLFHSYVFTVGVVFGEWILFISINGGLPSPHSLGFGVTSPCADPPGLGDTFNIAPYGDLTNM